MVIQPTVILMFFLLFVRLQRHWRRRGTDAIWAGAFVLVFIACALSQVTAAVNTARFHRIDPNNWMLFDWLQKHTRVGDVVSTTNLQLCTEIPVYTHNNVLLAEGSRTSGTNEELIERFLLANALASVPPSRVADDLRETDADPHPILPTHSAFLFEHSAYINLYIHRILEPFVLSFVENYQNLSLPAELARFEWTTCTPCRESIRPKWRAGPCRRCSRPPPGSCGR